MKLAIFGATGGLGREVVKAATARGHGVRALVRDRKKLDRDGVEIVEGDFSDPAAIRSTIEGVDAVVSCVGVTKGGDPEVFGSGMRHIVDAMRAQGLRRLVSISGAGLELEGDVTGIGRRILILALKLLARDVLRGKQLEWEVIRDSDLDWTLVRVGRMVDRPGSGGVSVGVGEITGSPMIAYSDVAAWMVEEVVAGAYVRASPFVSGRR